jgi:hypothetical protein
VSLLQTELNRVTGKESQRRETVVAPPAHSSFKSAGIAVEAAMEMAHGVWNGDGDGHGDGSIKGGEHGAVTHAVLHGHAPIPLHELERAIHHAVSQRLRDVFSAARLAAPPPTSTSPPDASSSSTNAQAPTSTTSPPLNSSVSTSNSHSDSAARLAPPPTSDSPSSPGKPAQSRDAFLDHVVAGDPKGVRRGSTGRKLPKPKNPYGPTSG